MQRSIRLNLDPAAYGARLAQIVHLATQKIALQVLRGVVLRTPVDTGRARSNWHVSVGTVEVLGDADPHAPGTRLGLSETGNANTTIAVGSATIEAAAPHRVIYLTNGLPYIMRLEEGWSQRQAPAGMVRVTLDQVVAQFASGAL